jgi:hypothetical protein
VSDEHAGKQVRCPACKATVVVPVPGPAYEVMEEEDGGEYRMEAKVAVPDEDEEDGKKKDKKQDEDKSERRTIAPPAVTTVTIPIEDKDEDERKKKKKKEKEGRPRSERAEVRELADRARMAAKARAEARRRREAMFRAAYLIAGPILTLAGIGVAVWAGNSNSPDSTTWMIVGGVVALCGFVAFLGLTGILPNE